MLTLAVLISVAMLGLSALLALAYRDQPLLGFHAFRQTQTALTSYWMCHGDLALTYLTPVVGYPWSIPFEFPIYQWIVSGIACPLGLELGPVGRLVSYVFWVACLLPSRRIFVRLFEIQAPLFFWVFTCLFLSTPIYLFWGRSFMIESAALFFALCFIACSLAFWRGHGRWRDALMTGAFLTLAILQKSTTVLPLLILPLFDFYKVFPELRKTDWIRSGTVWKSVVAYGAPFLIGLVWATYSDHVKMANPVGQFLTSKALAAWNFGTLDARFSQSLWIDVIWNRVITENVAGHLGVFLILAALAFAPLRRNLILVGLALFLLYFLVFENLLFVHHYYAMANTVYLVFALAVAIAALIEARPQYATIVGMALLSVIAIDLHFYFLGYLFWEEQRVYLDDNPVLEVSKFVRTHTFPTATLLVYGDDWSSELPYFSQRRALVVPNFLKSYLDPLDEPVKYLAGAPGAVLICGGARHSMEVEQKVMAHYGTWPKTSLVFCDVYIDG